MRPLCAFTLGLALALAAGAQSPARVDPSVVDYIFSGGRKLQLQQVKDAAFYRIQSTAKLAKDPKILASLESAFGLVTQTNLEQFAARKTAQLADTARSAIARLTRTQEATPLRVFTMAGDNSVLVEYPEIILQCDESTTLDQVRSYLDANYQVTVLPTGLRPGQFLIRVKTASHTLWLANQLRSTKGIPVRHADVNFWFGQPAGKAPPTFPAKASWPFPPDPNYPNDPAFSAQWALRNSGPTPALAKAIKDSDTGFARAYKLGVPDASGVTVAVLDYAIDVGHPELDGVIGYRFNATRYDPLKGLNDPDLQQLDYLEQPESDADHGTACAGLISARTANGIGISGIAPGARIAAIQIAIPATKDLELVRGLNLIAALRAVELSGARVASLSWGIKFVDSENYGAVRDQISSLNKAAGNLGVLLVAAAGNDTNNILTPDFPADYSGTATNVLAAGACNACGGVKTKTACEREPWNSRYNDTTLFAPGVGIFALTNRRDKTTPNAFNNYRTNFGGTSAATPLIAGAAALVIKQHPDWTAAQVRNHLFNSAAKLKVGGKSALDLCTALHGEAACRQ